MARFTLNIPTDFSPVYFCPKCHRPYKAEADARECDASDVAPVYEVGQIVRIDVGYGWFDGDEKWLIKDGKDGSRQLYAAYFVITAIDYDRSNGWHAHDPRYHIKTLGIKNGNPTGLAGHTFLKTHTPLIRVKQDPVLVAEGAKFIGKKSERLI